MSRPHRRLNAARRPFGRGIEFLYEEDRGPGEHFFATNLVVTKVEGDDIYTLQRPTFSLEEEEAQALMDALWFCGLRPSEGTGSAGSLAATERHLNDMRRLVFDPKREGL